MNNINRSLSLKLWWKKPRNAGDKLINRNVSYLELFYDLVYVVLLSKISHTLVHHFSLGGIGEFCFLFALIWLNWYNGAIYHDLHAKSDIRTRLFIFIEMFIIIFMSMFSGDAIGVGAIGFAICMGVYHFYWAFLWWITGIHDVDHTTIAFPSSINHLILAALFIISAFLASPYIYYIWAIILFISILVKVVSLDYGNNIEHNRQVSIVISPTHSIIERFSLFTIIVFGETIFGLVNGLTIENLCWMMVFKAMVGFLIVICFWSLYYDLISGKLYKKSKVNYFLWVYLHLFLLWL